jgi:hypothetical protein
LDPGSTPGISTKIARKPTEWSKGKSAKIPFGDLSIFEVFPIGDRLSISLPLNHDTYFLNKHVLSEAQRNRRTNSLFLSAHGGALRAKNILLQIEYGFHTIFCLYFRVPEQGLLRGVDFWRF